MTKMTDKKLDDILRELQSPFFDADTFFKEKRLERMRPNLSRRDREEYDTDVTVSALIAAGFFSEEAPQR
jgi:hypothetical protein